MSRIQDVIKDTKSKKSDLAKHSLMVFVEDINKELERFFDKEIAKSFGVSAKEKKYTKMMLEHIKEHNLRPCKRLRGSFVYYGHNLLGQTKKKDLLYAAMSIELIHTALLIHDDFMDQDDTRRGLPTTHEYYKKYHMVNRFRFDPLHFGESIAVNAGDAALMLGFEILGKSNFPVENILKAQNRTLRGIMNTAFGQAYDVTLEGIGKATEQDIIDLHLAKTAIYTYENPLHIGALLAGSEPNDLDLISEYAIPGGVAFQLQDDMLGLFGNPKKTGKPAHSDLRQGKMTLLIIKALEQASKEQKKNILKIWGNRNLTQKDADLIRKIVVNTGSLDYSRKVSVKYAKQAQSAIPKMIKKGWNKEAIAYLDGIAQYMVERDV
jgi:geranylgeranyl diphosphate synthase, type I